jgi:sigma-70-like protein
MASKTEETPQKEEMLEMEGPETLSDSPLLGLSDGAVRELVRSAKKRGYVTRDEINSVLPSEEVNSEQVEDVLAIFSEMGVNVVETEETSKEGEKPGEEGEGPREEVDEEAESESGELVEVQQKVPAKSTAAPKLSTRCSKEPIVRARDSGATAGWVTICLSGSAIRSIFKFCENAAPGFGGQKNQARILKIVSSDGVCHSIPHIA